MTALLLGVILQSRRMVTLVTLPPFAPGEETVGRVAPFLRWLPSPRRGEKGRG